MRYVVIDLETTGLCSGGYDRIIEVAVIEVSPEARVLSEWSTLVNPGRDLGPTYIHGIRGADCRDAPTFAQIAGDLFDRLHEVVVIGHNVRFDRRFLRAEFARAGVQPSIIGEICTLELARNSQIEATSRRLEVLCRAAGVALPNAHAALSDAHASLGLLRVLLDRAGLPHICGLGYSELQLDVVSPTLAEGLCRSGRMSTRASAKAAQLAEPSILQMLIEKLQDDGEAHPLVDAYLEVVDRVLLDRRVIAEERSELLQIALDLGLNGATVVAAHRRYMSEVMRLAWADGVLSELEREDLEKVRDLLGLSVGDYQQLLTATKGEVAERNTRAPTPFASQLSGKSVCFTGTLKARINGVAVTREHAESVAASRGMQCKSNVSGALSYLVAADPDSLSGKARKAKELGVTVLAEPVFWSMLGVTVD